MYSKFNFRLTSQKTSQDVTDRSVRIPDPKNETFLAFSEPVGHHCHHTWPAGRLEGTTKELNISKTYFFTGTSLCAYF